jgi:hypothetical protein
MKANNNVITKNLLQNREIACVSKGYHKQKWVVFCESLMSKGFTLKLYEARKTVSKYITVTHPGIPSKSFKVRFSNHKPLKHKEQMNDCDFFVGISNTKVTNTEMALQETLKYFGLFDVIENKKDKVG